MNTKKITLKKRIQIKRRSKRVRSKLSGSPVRPRLSVFRSGRHIYAQLIDDVKSRTLAASSDFDLPEKQTQLQAARGVGQLIAQKAKEKKITRAIFDRGPYRYHGCVKAVAEGAREGGLIF